MAITLLISVAGLFAMAHYSTQRRRREIALRKVNGATLRDLLLLLNRDFLLWTLAAYVVAVPVSVLFMRRWLQAFAVQAPLAVWVFLLVGCAPLLSHCSPPACRRGGWPAPTRWRR